MTAKIKLNAASGGGSVSLKAPSTTTSNAAVELQLPVADGTNGQVLKTDGSGNLSFAADTGGKILQVVTAELSSQASFTSNTHADIGLSASITPTSASNKILVEYNLNIDFQRAGSGNYEANASIQVLRNSTVILPPFSYGNSPQSTGSGSGHGDYFMSSGEGGVEVGTFFRFRNGYKLIDSPNTTSSTTYKLQGAIGNSSTLYINRTDSASQTPKSNIILMEVAA